MRNRIKFCLFASSPREMTRCPRKKKGGANGIFQRACGGGKGRNLRKITKQDNCVCSLSFASVAYTTEVANVVNLQS